MYELSTRVESKVKFVEELECFRMARESTQLEVFSPALWRCQSLIPISPLSIEIQIHILITVPSIPSVGENPRKRRLKAEGFS